ncbi:MAG: type II toxin-antitoxin system RelE/ParE family toxin [Candidatus Firestonebacteria bacterium]
MWTVEISRLVFEEDFKKIDKNDQHLIIRTVTKKLASDPENYGEPLKYGLKGFWKLKVMNYRVIYKIEKEKIKVFVVKVGLRRNLEVYKEMISRIRKL